MLEQSKIKKIKDCIYIIFKRTPIRIYDALYIRFERLSRIISGRFSKDGLKVIVVGPPRSGTSFLAGLIVRMGFYPGSTKMLKKATRINPYGFYELDMFCELDHDIIKKISGPIWEMPKLKKNWLSTIEDEKKIIKDTVDKYGIEIYKGNMLLVLSDLYYELYPNAKWIFITRNRESTVKSVKDALNVDKSSDDIEEVISEWMEMWKSSKAGKESLNLVYEDFFTDFEKQLDTLEEFLEAKLDDKKRDSCRDFFAPSNKKTD